MRIIISGSRTFDDFEFLEIKMDKIVSKLSKVEVVSGGCWGADVLGELWAYRNGYDITTFLPDWKKYGKSAGIIRNKQMAEYAYPKGCLVAFWDGNSSGTKNMISLGKEYGLQVRVIKTSGTGFASYFRNTTIYDCNSKKKGKRK